MGRVCFKSINHIGGCHVEFYSVVTQKDFFFQGAGSQTRDVTNETQLHGLYNRRELVGLKNNDKGSV